MTGLPREGSARAWRPKLVESLRTYDRRQFAPDLIAGVTVGLVALPLAMAFAIASGFPPAAGIYCAVVTGFLISALGGSRCQIGGPTGAFVVVVAGIVAKHGVDGLFMCTLMAGVLLVLMGVTGIGSAVKFIPRPVVVGFTNGIAVLIASTQIKDFFGVRLETVPGDFLEKMAAIARHLDSFSILATVLATASVAIIVFTRRYTPRISGTVLVLVGGTFLTWVLGLSVETIGSRFGALPSGLPMPRIPEFRPELILGLLAPTLTIAMLGAIESLMSAVVADRMSGDRHEPNVELIAQGIANVASPLFGGLPATGAIARTATNIRTGARTPVAGIIHALTLLCILIFAAPLAAHVPMPILAGILMMTAYTMGEWKQVPELLKLSRAEVAVWLLTFALTVLADLTVAVEAGMILAVFLFIRNVTETTTLARVSGENSAEGYVHILRAEDIPDHVAVFGIHGPFLFGSADKTRVVHDQLDRLPSVVILRLRDMTAIDATGLSALEDLAAALHRSGRHLIVCGAREQPSRLFKRSGFARIVGAENFCDNVLAALDRANRLAGVPAARLSEVGD